MAKNAIKRLLSTGFKTGSGILGAEIRAAQEKEELRRLKNQEMMAALLGHSLRGQREAATDLSRARIEESRKPKPEKEVNLTESQVLARILVEDPEEYIRIKTATKGKVETQPKDITGIGEFEDVVSRRRSEADRARSKSKQDILSIFQGLFTEREEGVGDERGEEITDSMGRGRYDKRFDTFSPEGLAAYVKDYYPETIEKKHWFKPNEILPNPDFEAAAKLLSGIQVPPEYQIPVGDEAVALGDSIDIGRQDEAMAAILMGGGQPSPAGESLSPAEEATVNYLNNNPEKVATYNWDALKAEHPDIDVEKIKRQLQ